MVRTLAAAAALVVSCLLIAPSSAFAQERMPPPVTPPPPPPSPGPEPPPQSFPAKMPHVRFYAGAAGVNQVASGDGGAGLLGVQWYADLFPIFQWYWGVELVGVKFGTGFISVADGDVGIRFTPFPDWPLRPYLRGNVGLSLLIVLPIPSAGLAAGLMLPIFNTLFIDIAIGGRRVYNVFDTNQTVDLGLLELSFGF